MYSIEGVWAKRGVCTFFNWWYHAISCIIMHHHASSCITSSNLDLDAHSKGRCGKWIFHDATGCSVYSPFLHCKAATWRGKGQGMSRNVNMSSAGTTFSGHNLVHQCSSTPWKGSNIFRYRMSQMNIFPHFVVLCTLNDYHRLFSIDYIMHHHASSCIIMHHHV